MKKIAIAGTGYAGLVTGVCLAEIGHSVICVDKDSTKVEILKKGSSPIYEPGLEEMLKRNLEAGTISFTASSSEGYKDAEIIIITVGTPKTKDGLLDLHYINQVSIEIGQSIVRPDVIIVTKSTVPAGTSEKIKEWIKLHSPQKLNFHIAANPEFLRQGSAIHDMFHGDRIIIGSESEYALNCLEDLYKPFGIPIMKTDTSSAELIKVAANAFLALKISYVNALSNYCEQIGGNIEDVAMGMGMDNRIGLSFLNAGIGFGGSCLPKDTEALVNMAQKAGEPNKLLEEALQINRRQELRLFQKAQTRFSNLKGKRVAILGLAYKPDTDDVRESAAIKLARQLVKEEASIIAFDPVSIENAKSALGELISYTNSLHEALKGADLALIVTDWEEIKTIDLNTFSELMKQPVVFDGRNCFQLDIVAKYPIEYHSIGRPSVYGKMKKGNPVS